MWQQDKNFCLVRHTLTHSRFSTLSQRDPDAQAGLPGLQFLCLIGLALEKHCAWEKQVCRL